MKKKVLGALAIGAASVGLMVLGTGTASAADDPTCLQESVQGVVTDPAGAVESTLADPLGAVGADVVCVGEAIGGSDQTGNAESEPRD
jgi:hypothetical protein